MSTLRSFIAWSALALVVVASSACQTRPTQEAAEVSRKIEAQVQAAQAVPATPVPPAVSQALLPPLTVEMPAVTNAIEPRFDLSVSEARADQVFMAIASGTPYSIIVHPAIKEPISIRLKDVTLREALDALREVYGYEHKIDGTRIYILPVSLQSRIFQVNYLAARRVGHAEVRVSSGSIQQPVGSAGSGAGPAASSAAPVGPSASVSLEGSRVTTSSDNDFWNDLQSTIRTVIGSEPGRTVVVNPNSGVIVVRAMPKELRAVDEYLKAMSLVVERQVMLEAKIVEVTLNDQYSAGINWAAFGTNSRVGIGIVQPGTVIRSDGSMFNSQLNVDPTGSRPSTPDPLDPTTGATGSVTRRFTTAPSPTLPASILGLALQTASFASLITFLESHGNVHVLSSPRIATLNNQKAVIKVGTDEFFVTNVQTTTVASGSNTTVSPTVTTQPFFSGIALDVTPQISGEDQITLHIHPSVSSVTDKTKVLDLGALGKFTLPLASSTVNESDTIVRVQDGTIAAIGGLMKLAQTNSRSGVPGTADSPVLGSVLGSRNQDVAKSELVILLKVTVIKGESSWQGQAQEVSERLQTMRR